MPATGPCPECGAPLPIDSPEGNCPSCLMRLAGAMAADQTPTIEARPIELPLVNDRSAVQSAAADASVFTPRSLGDYELLEEIARGGMGIVYKARQRGLDRIVALKLLLLGELSDDSFIQRFRVEAQATASLQHPNIVSVFESGCAAGQHFFAMEFVEGQTLAQLVREKPFPPRKAAGYVKAIAEAIQSAHEQGVLHRDLKPSNVLIDVKDRVRVTDFGLAKRLDGKSKTDLTVTGQVLGTPNYISPEQAKARKELSAATDVYALGGILYCLLTARPPFQAETLAETLQQVENSEPVSPRLLNVSVPVDLETICLKCLEKEPACRYSTARALAEELERFLNAESIHARPISGVAKAWRWCQRNRIIAGLSATAILLLVALAIGSTLAAYRIAAANQRSRANERIARERLYAADINSIQQALLNNNLGRARALLDRHRPRPGEEEFRGWEWRYFWKEAQGDEAVILRGHTDAITDLKFSPDGGLLASCSWDRTVRLWDWRRRRMIATLEGSPDYCTSVGFSHDGQTLFARSRNSAVVVWDVATQVVRQRTDGNSEPFGWPRLALSPAEMLVILDIAPRAGALQLWDGSAKSNWEALSTDGWSPAFSGDGKWLAAVERSNRIRIWNVNTRQIAHEIEAFDQPARVVAIALSADGSKLATGCADGRTAVWETFTSRRLHSGTNHTDRALAIEFSPDGSRYVSAGPDQTVRLWDVESGRPLIVLRGHSDEIWGAAFSRDGKSVATAGRDKTIRLWDVESLRASKTISTASTTKTGPVSISPNGQFVAGWGARHRQSEPSLDRSEPQLAETRLTIWNLENRQQVAQFDENPGFLTWGSDDHTIETLSSDLTWKRWTLSNREPTSVVKLDEPLANPMPAQLGVLSPLGRYVALGVRTNEVALWDMASRSRVALLQGRARIQLTLFSPDEKLLAISTADRSLTLVELPSLREVGMLKGHRGTYVTAAFSPDGKLLATGAGDNLIKLWDRATLRELATLVGHKAGLYRLNFSPDGKTLVSASGDRTARLWHVATYQEMATLPHGDIVRFAGFSSDGRTLITQERDSPDFHIWRAPTFDEIEIQEHIHDVGPE